MGKLWGNFAGKSKGFRGAILLTLSGLGCMSYEPFKYLGDYMDADEIKQIDERRKGRGGSGGIRE
jgi:hypothetical protein